MPKAELIPDLAASDGAPLDVGHDRALANTLNHLIDAKTAKSFPLLAAGTDRALAGLSGGSNDVWATMFLYPCFLGSEHLPAGITRSLYVAPFFRSATGGVNAWVRVTLLDQTPTMRPGIAEGAPTAGAYGDPMLPGKFSRSSEWTTSSATWQTGTAVELSLGVKDIFFGVCYVLIEGAGAADCRGLGICREGPRVVT
jgi:hypothetical protein